MLQPKILQVEPLSSYKLKLFYDTGETRIFDVAPYISGSWYEQLRDERYFKTARSLPNGAGIKWANGQDIAPHELYEMSSVI
ncbi:MAG: DUF2442 domain-containing protein [Elusimicrobiota bacterium]|jgi:hypothetical protein|nr:DUF2442 domain-containing protein [Elusimicrobiota bacterium]